MYLKVKGVTMENQTELSEIESNQGSEVNTQDTQESFNSKPLSAIPEPETDDLVYRWEDPKPQPWENAPENVYYYSRINEDGVIFDITESAELAYSNGYFDNQIPKDDVAVSDINNWHYLKSKCPMKTEEDLLKDQYRLEITQLKKALSDIDYKLQEYRFHEIISLNLQVPSVGFGK